MFKENVDNILKIILIVLVVFFAYVATVYLTLVGLVFLLMLIYIIRPNERFVLYRKLISGFSVMVVVFYVYEVVSNYAAMNPEVVGEILKEIKNLTLK